MYPDERTRRSKWLLLLAALVVALLMIGLNAIGCALGEQFREPLKDAAIAGVTPFTTEEFWYGAARGILRAWSERAAPTPASPLAPGASTELVVALTTTAALFYPILGRRIRLWLKSKKSD